MAKAADLDSANRVLRRFITDYNRRFAHKPDETETAWRPAPERLVSNDNAVQWEGYRLQTRPQNRLFGFSGPRIQLYQALDGRVSQHTDASGITFW